MKQDPGWGSHGHGLAPHPIPPEACPSRTAWPGARDPAGSAGPEALPCALATGPRLSSLAKLHRPPAPPPTFREHFGGAASRLPLPLLLFGRHWFSFEADARIEDRFAVAVCLRRRSPGWGIIFQKSAPLRGRPDPLFLPTRALDSSSGSGPQAHVFNASPDSAWPPHGPPGPWGQALEGSASGCFLSVFPGPAPWADALGGDRSPPLGSRAQHPPWRATPITGLRGLTKGKGRGRWPCH